MRKNYPDFLCMKCNAQICCLCFVTSNPGILHSMMASHGDGNKHRSNDGRNRSNTSRQFITQDQIRYARRVYAGEADMGPNPSPQELAALRFVVQEHKD
jgi:hypothetical protein